jgi:N-ethylmaleimide reductase
MASRVCGVSRSSTRECKRLIRSIKLSPGGGFGDSSFSSAEELVATHRYLVEELEKRHLAYLQFVNYDADFDPHHGGEAQGYDHDVLATYSDLVHGQRIMANLGWTSDSATTELAKPESKVYAFAFGRASIANPDLPIRMRCGYPLQEGNPKVS